jgi:hypothetical protein
MIEETEITKEKKKEYSEAKKIADKTAEKFVSDGCMMGAGAVVASTRSEGLFLSMVFLIISFFSASIFSF